MTSESPRYRSWIPASAEERVTDYHKSGAKWIAEYFLDGLHVGTRRFDESGQLEGETPLKDGQTHGVVYRFDEPGVLLSEAPYRDGVPHGVAKQWFDGELIGSYGMVRGTGIDLWWEVDEKGRIQLSEVHHYRDGLPDGFEWWLYDRRTVWWERHWKVGEFHGIERQWSLNSANWPGGLGRGYPKYWIEGTQVTKARYLVAAREDSSLPAFRDRDNAAQRRWPADIADAVRPRKLTRAHRLVE